MSHKNDYSCIAYFADGKFKKWSYVHKLNGFVGFLNRDHQSWKYFNVYDRRTAKFLKRFYPGNIVPDFLTIFLFATLLCSLLQFGNSMPLNSTFSSSPSTFNNGFNNTATISTRIKKEGGSYEPS